MITAVMPTAGRCAGLASVTHRVMLCTVAIAAHTFARHERGGDMVSTGRMRPKLHAGAVTHLVKKRGKPIIADESYAMAA